MKRLVITSFFLFFAVSFTYGQIVDFTGIDLQTESVKVIDETTRPTGCVFGIGGGYQGIPIPEIDYTSPLFKFDLMFFAFQFTPQFLWNAYDFRIGVGDLPLYDFGTQFLYYFSPKKAGSWYASGRIGYAFSGGEHEVNEYYRANVHGLTVGFSGGYAWEHFRLEAFVDMLDVEVYQKKLCPSFGAKIIYYGICEWE